MSDVLSKVKERLGVDGVDQLSAAERQTYLKYEQILTKKFEVSDIANILRSEIRRLEDLLIPDNISDMFGTTINHPKRDLWLKARIKNYRDLLRMIEEPERNKKQLEAHLIKLFDLKK